MPRHVCYAPHRVAFGQPLRPLCYTRCGHSGKDLTFAAVILDGFLRGEGGVKPAYPPDPEAAAVSVRLLPSEQTPRVGVLWRALEQRLGHPGLTCSWDWTESWLHQYGSQVPHRFVVGEAGGETRGIVLLCEGVGRRRGPFRIRSLHLGTAGEPPGDGIYVEYNRLLVDPAWRWSFAGALMNKLRQDRGWDRLELDGFVPDDAAALLASEPTLVPSVLVCPAVDLTALTPGGEVLQLLRPSTQRRLRRSLRVFGAVSTEWAETANHALEILDELASLHEQRWRRAGRRGAFASPRFTGFHRELIPKLLGRGQVALFRVRAKGATIGCLYCFVEDGRVLFYQSGVATSQDNRLKPGLVTHLLCMQAAADRGLREYNLLAGEGRYKLELSTVERELVWAVSERTRAKIVIANALRSARRLVRRIRARAATSATSGTPQTDGPQQRTVAD